MIPRKKFAKSTCDMVREIYNRSCENLAVCYARVGTEEQVRGGVSLDVQSSSSWDRLFRCAFDALVQTRGRDRAGVAVAAVPARCSQSRALSLSR